MPGLVASDPDRALDIHAETLSNFRDVRYRMFWTVFELGGVYAKQLAEGGNDAGTRRLLALTESPARGLLVSSAVQACAAAGKPKEALAFIDQNQPEPWKRSDFPALDYADFFYDRGEYVREILLSKPEPSQFTASSLRCHGEGATKSGGCICRVPIRDGCGISTTLFSENAEAGLKAVLQMEESDIPLLR